MTDQEIINATLRELPVGNLNTHTPDSIPERVAYFVSEYAKANEKLERLGDLVTTEHESKAAFIHRVRAVLHSA
jgi:hypothetical protein